MRITSSISISNNICIFLLVQRTFFTTPLTRDLCRTGLHNSEISKGPIINTNLPRATNVYFISMWIFPCSMREIPERQLLIRSRACATFSTIEKSLAGRKKSFRGAHVVRGPFVVQGYYRRVSAKDWSEWRWAFSFYGIDTWLLLHVMCGTKRLNPFFRLHEASEVLNKYVMGMWSGNSPLPFSLVHCDCFCTVPDIEGIQSKAICLWIGTTCSVNVMSTCSDSLYEINRRKPSRRPPNLK